MKRDPQRFSEIFEQIIALMTDSERYDRELLLQKVAEMAEYFNISKAVTEFYRSPMHEKTGKGDVIVGYDNGKGDKLIHTRRVVPKSQAIVQGKLYMSEDSEPLTPEELEKADITLRAVLSFMSRNRLVQIVEQLGFYDEYGFRNIRYFIRNLWALKEEGKVGRYAAVRYNLRHFSLVNRDIGRSAGDVVLHNHYKAIEGAVGESGVVCRVGGDNFICCFEKEYLDEVIEKIRSIPVEYDESGSRIMISCTAGVYVFPDDYVYETPDDVMDGLTSASNRAKMGNGDGVVFFDDNMVGLREKMLRVQGQFPEALAGEEFVAFYQPKVDIVSGRIVGAEALCRWYHEGNMVVPADFIPILEQNSDICKLDFYMLAHVCRDIRRWLDEGKRVVRVSVNLSRKHLMDLDLLKTILRIIDGNNVPHEYIEIELTETTSYVEFDNLKRIVGGLQQAGIYTSVDDFGIGYSSLNLIREIPWDVLKVDRCFLPAGAESRGSVTDTMFRHVVTMAQDIGLECVAEGVETSAQLDVLRDCRCHIAQGFLFDRPLPVKEFEKKLDGSGYDVG